MLSFFASGPKYTFKYHKVVFSLELPLHFGDLTHYSLYTKSEYLIVKPPLAVSFLHLYFSIPSSEFRVQLSGHLSKPKAQFPQVYFIPQKLLPIL